MAAAEAVAATAAEGLTLEHADHATADQALLAASVAALAVAEEEALS